MHNLCMNKIITKQEYKIYCCLRQEARHLRNSPTPQMQQLWWKLRKKRLLNVQFLRQKILLNRYLVAFYAPQIKLAIQIGAQQNETLDQILATNNITIKRYSASMVSDQIGYVIQDLHKYIWQKLNYPARMPLTIPPLFKGGGRT